MEERVLTRASDYSSDSDEALSLSDLPVTASVGRMAASTGTSLPETEEFEFSLWGGGRAASSTTTEMCAAEDVFYRGQILPLRPSVSSDAGNGSGSRSESMDRSSSCGFNSTSRSSSGSSSSRSSSFSRVSNSFYAHPSPKPQLGSRHRYKSAGSSGRISNWGLLRLGPVKPPEIELGDLRQRRSAKKIEPEKGQIAQKNQKKKTMKSLGLPTLSSLSCKCSSASETIPSQNVVGRRREEPSEEAEQRLLQKKDVAHRRTFEWLKELPMADVPLPQA